MNKKRCEKFSPSILPAEDDKTLAELAQALSHPARVAIVRLLMDRNTCLCGDFVVVLPLAQSTVSQHLKTLKEVGLVQGETDGPRSCYCLNPAALERLQTLLGEI
jgi:ArsR family transcriptional regulator